MTPDHSLPVARISVRKNSATASLPNTPASVSIETDFLWKMKNLEKIGFNSTENLKYELSYAKWKPVEEFMEIDKWQEGRDDQKAFNWLREWWIRNNQFLVFKDSVWMIGGIDESDPENKLLD